MAKKKNLEELDEVIESLDKAPEKKAKGLLTLDFGREDLNLMRDKINELIARD